MQSRLQKILIKISQFMYGRNGLDKFSIFLLVLSLILNGVNSFVRAVLPYISISAVSVAILLYAFYRMLSKNTGKRQEENRKFENLLKALRFNETIHALKSREKSMALRLRYIKTHRFRRCPDCHEFLRINKKRGKRELTCPKCGRNMKIRIWF